MFNNVLSVQFSMIHASQLRSGADPQDRLLQLCVFEERMQRHADTAVCRFTRYVVKFAQVAGDWCCSYRDLLQVTCIPSIVSFSFVATRPIMTGCEVYSVGQLNVNYIELYLCGISLAMSCEHVVLSV